jgi:GNAT superfamily N-acetyltransferase
VLLRPLRDDEEDAEAVRVVSAAAFGSSRVLPVPDDPARAARHRERNRHLARTDPGGCWLAVDEASGMPVGAALSLRREGTWGLSTFVVLPEAQGRGVGRELLAAAMHYGRGCLRGIICGSSDPRAAGASVCDLTADQQWALDVGLIAGLDITNAGYVCLRGMRPPTPYVPSGAFL